MYYPGNRCRKLEVYTNFRVFQEFEILEHLKSRSRKVCEKLILEFL